MDSLLSSFQGPPGGQLKLAATAQLGLCIMGSAWLADTAGAVAMLGILSVVLSNLELLQLVRFHVLLLRLSTHLRQSDDRRLGCSSCM